MIERCRPQLQRKAQNRSFSKFPSGGAQSCVKNHHAWSASPSLTLPRRRTQWPNASLPQRPAWPWAIHLCLIKPGSTNHMASHWLSVMRGNQSSSLSGEEWHAAPLCPAAITGTSRLRQAMSGTEGTHLERRSIYGFSSAPQALLGFGRSTWIRHVWNTLVLRCAKNDTLSILGKSEDGSGFRVRCSQEASAHQILSSLVSAAPCPLALAPLAKAHNDRANREQL